MIRLYKKSCPGQPAQRYEHGLVDTAYKMNRFTGNVWLIKTYVKQVGQLRVLSAREAAVEATQDMSGDANLPRVATR